MRAERRPQKAGDVWYFTCRSRTGKTAWRCANPAAVKDDGGLERWIVERFLAAIPRLRVTARAASPRLDELEQAANAAKDAFDQWRDDDRIQQRLGMDTYLKGLEARRIKLTAGGYGIRARTRVTRRRCAAPGAEDIAGHWPDLTPTEQRDLLRSAIRCVFVRGSRRAAPLDGRLHLVWQGEDIALPERGRRSWTAQPFVFRDD